MYYKKKNIVLRKKNVFLKLYTICSRGVFIIVVVLNTCGNNIILSSLTPIHEWPACHVHVTGNAFASELTSDSRPYGRPVSVVSEPRRLRRYIK